MGMRTDMQENNRHEDGCIQSRVTPALSRSSVGDNLEKTRTDVRYVEDRQSHQGGRPHLKLCVIKLMSSSFEEFLIEFQMG
jgi:hypothetical protein